MIILHYHHNTTAYRCKNRINFAIYQTFSRNNVLSEGHTLKNKAEDFILPNPWHRWEELY